MRCVRLGDEWPANANHVERPSCQRMLHPSEGMEATMRHARGSANGARERDKMGFTLAGAGPVAGFA